MITGILLSDRIICAIGFTVIMGICCLVLVVMWLVGIVVAGGTRLVVRALLMFIVGFIAVLLVIIRID